MTDLSAYKSLYSKTAKENLQALKDGIAVLSDQPTNKEAIEQAHRNAHTLKSKSILMGQQEIGDFAKVIEDALSDVIHKKSTPSQEMLETLTNQAMQIEEILKQVQDDKKEI